MEKGRMWGIEKTLKFNIAPIVTSRRETIIKPHSFHQLSEKARLGPEGGQNITTLCWFSGKVELLAAYWLSTKHQDSCTAVIEQSLDWASVNRQLPPFAFFVKIILLFALKLWSLGSPTCDSHSVLVFHDLLQPFPLLTLSWGAQESGTLAAFFCALGCRVVDNFGNTCVDVAIYKQENALTQMILMDWPGTREMVAISLKLNLFQV